MDVLGSCVGGPIVAFVWLTRACACMMDWMASDDISVDTNTVVAFEEVIVQFDYLQRLRIGVEYELFSHKVEMETLASQEARASFPIWE